MSVFSKQLILFLILFIFGKWTSANTCGSCCSGGSCVTAFQGEEGVCCGGIEIDSEWAIPYCCPKNALCIQEVDPFDTTKIKSFKCEILNDTANLREHPSESVVNIATTPTPTSTTVYEDTIQNFNKLHLIWIIAVSLLLTALSGFAVYHLIRNCCPLVFSGLPFPNQKEYYQIRNCGSGQLYDESDQETGDFDKERKTKVQRNMLLNSGGNHKMTPTNTTNTNNYGKEYKGKGDNERKSKGSGRGSGKGSGRDAEKVRNTAKRDQKKQYEDKNKNERRHTMEMAKDTNDIVDTKPSKDVHQPSQPTQPSPDNSTHHIKIPVINNHTQVDV